jgi:hypothetical protein
LQVRQIRHLLYGIEWKKRYHSILSLAIMLVVVKDQSVAKIFLV